MLRFVLLYHDCPPDYLRPSHWDFMLEAGDVLRTWALEHLPNGWRAAHDATQRVFADCPPIAGTDRVAAEQLADHRRAYLEFEGELSGNRGRVTRIAAGTYQMEIDSPTKYRVLIAGDRITGCAELKRVDATNQQWSVTTASLP